MSNGADHHRERPTNTTTRCDLCGTEASPEDLARGAKLALCRNCVSAGLAASLASTARARDGQTVSRAFRSCSLCEKPTPPASLHAPENDGVSACSRCLAEAYALLTQSTELARRRRLIAASSEADKDVASLLEQHFEGLGGTDVVTTSRTFSAHLRADLQRALDALLPADRARSVGLHTRYRLHTLTYAALGSQDNDPVQIAPLSYDEVDVGEDEPVRCLRSALWLAETDAGLRYALVLSPATEHGRDRGWHVELCVPAGAAGAALVRRHFATLQAAIEASASYRGKVLSLECEPHYNGMSAGAVIVHRLAPVERGSIILPEKTLALLERNVFRFIAQRERLRAHGMPVKKGLLFYGPPGTGKTHTIRYLARLPEHTTLLITAEQVAAIGTYMALARLLSPCVVVIEDVDLIARDRSELDTPEQESLLNRLLNEMDGLRDNSEVLFILTTNRPEALEAALAGRPGRIDQAIEFPLPDEEGRHRLIELYRRGLDLPESVRAALVPRTEGVSAAFIKELLRRGAQFAFERDPDAHTLTAIDLDSALRELLFEGGALNAKLLGARATHPEG